MQIAIAELPEQTGEDRALAFDAGVIVLDGASSHGPDIPPAARYVDVLGPALATRIARTGNLAELLAESIRSAADVLGLQPNSSPSSTVAIVRVRSETVEVMVLGDTAIVVGFANGRHEVIIDNRLNTLDIPASFEYRRRLAEGSGYDDTHRGLLRKLQRRQRLRRNRSVATGSPKPTPRLPSMRSRRRTPVNR